MLDHSGTNYEKSLRAFFWRATDKERAEAESKRKLFFLSEEEILSLLLIGL
jgi:hypothetical protein